MTKQSARLTYKQVQDRLLSMPRFADVGDRAANFALEQIQNFLHDTGDFSKNIPAIHVAGTNGKGTVCSMLASVYTRSGYKTGLYTSPHLTDVRERFRIDGEIMPESELIDFFEEMDVVLARHTLTFFELTTVIAFWYFNRKGVDIAIIETGLGGRLDATNIITPVCSVITSIGMDHMEQLGNTIEEIAAEKAGILKKKIPFITGDIHGTAQQVIRERGEAIGAIALNRLTYPTKLMTDVPSVFEKTNIDLVYTITQKLSEQYPLDDIHFREALSDVRTYSGLQGRLQKLHPQYNLYFDGAHNVDGLNALGAYLEKKYDLQSSSVVVAMMKDKLSKSMQSFFERFGKVYFFELNQPRLAKLADFQTICPIATQIYPTQDIVESLRNQSKTQLVLFTGSFYFYSVVSEWMGTYKTTTSN